MMNQSIKLAMLGMLLSPTFLLAKTNVNAQIEQLEIITQAQNNSILQLNNQLTEALREIDLLKGRIDVLEHEFLSFKNNVQNVESTENAETGSNSTEDIQLSENESENNLKENNKQTEEYQAIVKMIVDEKEYFDAYVKLMRFAEDYPESEHSSGVTYWLGQLNYAENKFEDAQKYFIDVVKKYPNSVQAAESMYKVGLILEKQNELSKSKSIFQEVIKRYPESAFANQAKEKVN